MSRRDEACAVAALTFAIAAFVILIFHIFGAT